MRILLPALLLAAASASCATSPAMRSPLKERLAASDTPAVEEATRACLTDEGWKVDPIGSISGGSNVVSAKMKDKEPTQVYVHAPDQSPRVTGGPDDKVFWKCLAEKLGGEGGGDQAGDGGKDDKGKGDKDDKGGGGGDKDSGEGKDDKGS